MPGSYRRLPLFVTGRAAHQLVQEGFQNPPCLGQHQGGVPIPFLNGPGVSKDSTAALQAAGPGALPGWSTIFMTR